MGNNGLKNKNEIIQKVVGNTEILCNVSKYHGNVSLKINLLSTIGAKQVDFFLYYNEYNSSNVGFGTGVTCNFYNRLDYSNNQVIMTTFDGLQYTFDYVGSSKYYCTELNQTIEENSNHFCLYDGFGNEYHYPSTGNYPNHIIFGQSGYSLVFSISGYKLRTIEVESGSRVINTIDISYSLMNNSFYATTITCTKPNNTYNISYSSGKISAITSIITGETDLITNMSYTYNQYEIIVLDNIARRRCKIYYGPNTLYQTYDIDKIEEDYYINNSSVDKITTFVSQENGYVKIYDNYGNSIDGFYDNENIEYFVDANYNLQKCIYDNYNRSIGNYSKISIYKDYITNSNLVLNGYFESGDMAHWSVSGTDYYGISSDSSHPLSSALGPYYFHIKRGNSDCYFEQTIEKKGTELDSFTLVFWAKQITYGTTDANDMEIDVIYNGSNNIVSSSPYTCHINIPHKADLDHDWHPYVFDVTKNKNFDSITLKISLKNTGIRCAFDGILLINNKVHREETYYLFGKKEKEENRNEVINYIHNYHDSHNNIDKLGMIIDNDGRVTKYTYDDDCYNVIEEKSSNLTITKTYDTIEKNNLLKEEMESNSKKLITEYTYTDSKDFLQTIKDYDDSITTYYTNELRGNVTNTTYSNGLNMHNAYDTKDNVEVRKVSGSNFLKKLYYTYENFGSFNEIKMNNSYKYDFDYVNNKLSQIKVNNSVLENITYKSTYPYAIEEITKGTNGDKVKFSYNSYGNLISVSYKLKGENNYTLKYEFIYDNIHHNEIKRIINYSGNDCFYKDFHYDNLNNIDFIGDTYNQNYEADYLYDDYNLVMNDIHVDNKKRLEVLPSKSKKQIATKEDLRISAFYQLSSGREKYYCFFNGEEENSNNLKYILSTNASDDVERVISPSDGGNITPTNDNGNWYLPLSSSSVLKYEIPSQYLNNSNGSLINGAISFLFIPSVYSTINTIFSIYDKNGYSRLVCENANNNIVINLYDSNNTNIKSYNLGVSYKVSTINYFGFSYSFNLHTHAITFRFLFNNYTLEDTFTSTNQVVFNSFSVASHNGTTSTASSFELYSLMFMPLLFNINVLSKSELIKNYHLLKDIYETPIDRDEVDSMDTYISNKVTDSTDFIPLSNSFISKNGIKPIRINKRYDEDLIRNKYFVYNYNVRQNMLKLDGINLVYDIIKHNSFTISMNVIFNRFFDTNYIYTIKDNNEFISLLVKNGFLYIDLNGSQTNTNLAVVPNTLYFISLELDYIIPADSLLTNYYKVRTVCNGHYYQDTITLPLLSNPLLIIGSNGINEEVNSFMDGYVSSLCYKNAYMSVESINLLQDDARPVTTETKYDYFGRVTNKYLIKENIKLIKTLDYIQVEDTPSTNKDTMFINSEIVKDRNYTTLYQRSYEYGTNYSYGNITKIKENNSLVNQYYYNEKGYLITSYDINYGKNENFEYDDNGNITRKLIRSNIDGTIYDDISFYYDTTWPDRLVQINNKKIDYDSDSIGQPKHYGYFNGSSFTSGITYSWRCSKLIGLNDSINNKTISYDYDEEGKRIRKTVNNVSHYYYYEGNRLLAETYGNNRLDFLYDENSELIGFDYTSNNSTNRYYYIKNILGDIIKIVDNSSAIVVSYLYSSYGEVLSISGTLSSTIGNINPFRYRSYYYDIDTSMYYLKTRYYNPEWGRFISSDNISYLEYDNPLGVNLFSYCNNNPIMNVDPEGTFNWKRALGIMAEVLVDIVAITVGQTVRRITGSRTIGFAAYSMVQNTVNSFYYSCISNGESDLDSSSYNIDDKEFRYLTRWERLDYTKKETQSTSYGLNEMRFFGEYTAHMWAWGISKWAYGKDIPLFSWAADHSREADISPDHGETGDNYWLNIFYIIFGLLGA